MTLVGIVAPAGDELRETTAPPVKAGDVSCTVQVEPAEGETEAGLQARLLKLGVCSILTVPLLADTGTGAPLASAAAVPDSWMMEDGSGALPDSVRVTVARTASGIVLSFNPQAMHVAVPAEVTQVTDLPVPEAPAPAATLMDEKSVVEYPSVHSADAGKSPVAFKVRLRDTVLPGAAAPDDRLSEVWAKQDKQTASATIEMRISRDRSACVVSICRRFMIFKTSF